MENWLKNRVAKKIKTRVVSTYHDDLAKIAVKSYSVRGYSENELHRIDEDCS